MFISTYMDLSVEERLVLKRYMVDRKFENDSIRKQWAYVETLVKNNLPFLYAMIKDELVKVNVKTKKPKQNVLLSDIFQDKISMVAVEIETNTLYYVRTDTRQFVNKEIIPQEVLSEA